MTIKQSLRAPVMYGVSVTADALQLAADLTGFGVAASEIAEPYIGVTILALFKLFGVSVITNPKRVISMIAGGALDALSGGAAPFWWVDVWYILRDVKQDEAELEAQKQTEKQSTSVSINYNGMRMPQTQTANSYNQSNSNTGTNGHIAPAPPLNFKGSRRPIKTSKV